MIIIIVWKLQQFLLILCYFEAAHEIASYRVTPLHMILRIYSLNLIQRTIIVSPLERDDRKDQMCGGFVMHYSSQYHYGALYRIKLTAS